MLNWMQTRTGEIADTTDSRGRTIRGGYYRTDAGEMVTWVERGDRQTESTAHKTPAAARRAIAYSFDLLRYN